jgi:hypothetical protein
MLLMLVVPLLWPSLLCRDVPLIGVRQALR